ncbi:MAG TPA: Ppx/GppA family phosphatase [Candidatus Sulfotelmatobacter sp.]|nr:Ppx/GppA family phosphatase [Candidatus Sulfotelmatobacter sp.]
MPALSESKAVIAAAAHDHSLAVIDIGSNSVRLVVFEGPPRAPVPKFNEKVLCGLGRGLSESSRLNEPGVEQAFETMRRFVALIGRMGVAEVQAVATAAVRDAENGGVFVAELERRSGLKVRILSGTEEARFSALGVLSGIPDADGVVGDLGGGSLELIEVAPGKPGQSVTLPLGPFRLQALPEAARRDHVDAALASAPWLGKMRGRKLYLVGGAWRTIARIHMAQANYPVHIIHHYRIGAAQADEITRLLSRQSKESLLRIEGISRRRLDVLPLAALTLRRLLKRVNPTDVVFSAYGLREGLQFAALPEAARRLDPLLVACRDMAAREGRFGEHGDELAAFLAPLFGGETPAEARLRLAACLLSDTAWRVSPDDRGEEAFRHILRVPFAGLDHPAHALIALAVYARYQGNIDDKATLPGRALVDEQQARWALTLGLALRLAHTLTGGSAGLSREARLKLDGDRLTLEVPAAAEDLLGEVVQRRLEALARSLDRKWDLKVAKRR